MTIAIDLAKTVFELAAADDSGRILERRRLSRPQLERYFSNREVDTVVMEACGTAHHWGRWFARQGIRVQLLPAHYVRAYVRRDKTDRADATALLEASRATDITPVTVKSVEQQALQGLHRIRAAWGSTQIARTNQLRGLCREFGIAAPVGNRGIEQLARAVASGDSEVPEVLRGMLLQLLEELRELKARELQVEKQLAEIARRSDACKRLTTIPGVGVITATAMVGGVGDIRTFRNSRCFAGWLGLTPREHSSGLRRKLGSISKRGDGYLRMLLVFGGRAVLWSANCAKRVGRPLTALQAWALRLEARTCHNKAAIGVANKLARIIWATWSRERDFESSAEMVVPA
ncbi:MAG: IS110 family transposase [Proteobacteria bacterium]|nr:IS110 family transposase [Pseudomonadota bacterium]